MTDRSPTSGDRTDDDRITPGNDGTYRWTDGVEPSVSVVEAVADATGCEATSLPTLHDVVDVDAMNHLLQEAGSSEEVQLTFEYAGRTVEVRSSGSIHVDAQ